MFWINAPGMEAHLYARQKLSAPQTSETEEEEPRVFIYAAVSTPGCRNGNWTRNVKKTGRGGGTDGQWRRGRNHPGEKKCWNKGDCSKHITEGGVCVWQSDASEWWTSLPTETIEVQNDWLDPVRSPGTTSQVHHQSDFRANLFCRWAQQLFGWFFKKNKHIKSFANICKYLPVFGSLILK